MRILIAGCGYVGSELGKILLSQNHTVFGLRRNIDAIPNGIIPIKGDVCRLESLRFLPGDLDTVIYCAAAKARSESVYRQIYVDGLRNIFTQCAERSPNLKRLLYASSTSVYGQKDGSIVNEQSATKPTSFTGKIILEGEAHLERFPVMTSAIRFSGIYGPGRTHLIHHLKQGSAQRKPEDYISNRIHRDDCAGFLAHLVALSSPDETYIASDSAPVPYNQVLAFLATQIGVNLPSKVQQTESKNKTCSNANLLNTGYTLKFPTYKEGYGALLNIV